MKNCALCKKKKKEIGIAINKECVCAECLMNLFTQNFKEWAEQAHKLKQFMLKSYELQKNHEHEITSIWLFIKSA